jgi:hypothetical protein
MTEQEWTIVTLAFTDLFDIVKKVAPEQINVNKIFLAGKILQQEHNRIRAQRLMFTLFRVSALQHADSMKDKMIQNDWQKHNEELEKKKEAERAQELGDLTDTLKASIEKAEKDRQGE